MAETRLDLKISSAKFTFEERKKLCDAWAKTKLSRNEFIRQNNLPYSFHAWCRKLLTNKSLTAAKSPTGDSDSWIQILPKDKVVNIIEQPKTAMKLTCNNLTVNFSIPSDQIITFIKELSNATTIIR
ncbi:MAG: hypothetical protein K2Q18_12945 [Bdellovibrionales bacterium]|nr:hypothetical protein [Bdellovibrionales bacterium]